MTTNIKDHHLLAGRQTNHPLGEYLADALTVTSIQINKEMNLPQYLAMSPFIISEHGNQRVDNIKI